MTFQNVILLGVVQVRNGIRPFRKVSYINTFNTCQGQYLLEIQAMISFLGNGANGGTHIHSVCEADEFDCR